jgi:hypothetical protein
MFILKNTTSYILEHNQTYYNRNPGNITTITYITTQQKHHVKIDRHINIHRKTLKLIRNSKHLVA